ITLAVAEESIQHRAVLYDREGDYHFDTISAFIKSMRGSDPDAVFYWLAKMIYAGEDPRFIFRRMLIFASEDIGMADPHALPFVTACAESFDRVSLPKGHFPLAHAALYCATAPKSNSVLGFFDALKFVEHERDGEVPNHLRDASRDAKGFGHGVGYKYPHEYRNHWVAQQYLPSSLQGRVFYEPGELGYESTLAQQIRERRELQLAALRETENLLAPPEILTFSPSGKTTEQWLARAVDSLAGFLATLRAELFRRRRLQRHERILDLTADSGLLTWEAVRQVPEGGVWALVHSEDARRVLLEQAGNLPELRQPQVLVGEIADLPALLEASGNGDVKFDFIIGRNAMGRLTNRDTAWNVLHDLLDDNGTIALAENLPRRGQRLSRLSEMALPEEIFNAEERIYANADDPLLGWDVAELKAEALKAGFGTLNEQILEAHRTQLLPPSVLERWMNENQPSSYASRLLAAGLSAENLRLLKTALGALSGKTVNISSVQAVISNTPMQS
ncbi:MAG: AAA family ATPase, partial [Lentisphaeria bacterium]|nr:AAA family ATPase [Lentisphaeria bacterium]